MEDYKYIICAALDYILPNVLHSMIIEYYAPVLHDLLPIKFAGQPYSSPLHFCVDGNIIYTYCECNLSISNKTHDSDILNSSKNMCVYKDRIYVLDSNILIFNKKCKLIKTIANIRRDTHFIVVNDHICMSSPYGKYINITSIKNNKLENIIDLQSSKFYSMKADGEYIFVLTYAEILYRCTIEGKIIETYIFSKMHDSIKNFCVMEFCIIDDVVYMIDRDITDIITIENNMIVRKNVRISYHTSYRMEYWNGMLYVNGPNSSIIAFKIVQKKI